MNKRKLLDFAPPRPPVFKEREYYVRRWRPDPIYGRVLDIVAGPFDTGLEALEELERLKASDPETFGDAFATMQQNFRYTPQAGARDGALIPRRYQIH